MREYRKSAGAILVSAMVAAACGGCVFMNQYYTDSMPGLADVRVMGPQGQKCYDSCAVSHANCQHMCPRTEYREKFDCADDCVTDSKLCLDGCPELQRPIAAAR
jgi:hypothetical protein